MTTDAHTRDGADTVPGPRVPTGDPVYFAIVEFLEDEAAALDRSDLMGWVSMLAPDVVYRMPVRQTRDRDGGSEFASGSYHINDSAQSLFIKAMRLAQAPSAWAENPPSRTRRFVTNIRVHESPVDAEYRVTSSVLLVRNRYDRPTSDLLSAERRDVVRATDDGFVLAERYVYVDQATIGTPNLAVYL
jgi:3-phenylpropionate/cinnamic acid dioxygenase small subunit